MKNKGTLACHKGLENCPARELCGSHDMVGISKETINEFTDVLGDER
jgi:hypothetical protein